MIKLHAGLIWQGCAQGKYTIKAKGYILGILRWGGEEAPLPDWDPFAYVPIDPAGNGSFFFSGRRAIPEAATHIWARLFLPDFSAFEDAAVQIPQRYLPTGSPQEVQCLSVLTDLHLSAKPWMVKRALGSTESPVILLLGDSTNDGRSEQFQCFMSCIEKTVPDKSIFPVIGNHDVLHPSHPDSADGCSGYEAFQSALLTGRNGYAVSFAPDRRAYSVRIGELDVIGLQCVTGGRKFLFPQGEQIDWLEKHLSETSAQWHIILCHAPILRHNPNRNDGPPYLDRNKRLEEIIDRCGRIIFLSGHTHVSPNVLIGSGEYDERHGNIYLDCGSVVDTDISLENGLMAADWKDGCKTELKITRDSLEICMSSISSGMKFPRGYYKFHVPQKDE